jgi:chemotaxis protein MotA
MTEQITDPFMVSGIQMAVDGTDPELIEAIMIGDLEAIEGRHFEGKALFETVGRFAPAFGMIGTLIGLVILLKNMEDPSTIGPAMAIALLTTLYGALVANVVALPLADKLARRSREEMLLKMIIVKGVMSIQSGDNPRIVEQKLKTFLPARVRASIGAEAAA